MQSAYSLHAPTECCIICTPWGGLQSTHKEDWLHSLHAPRDGWFCCVGVRCKPSCAINPQLTARTARVVTWQCTLQFSLAWNIVNVLSYILYCGTVAPMLWTRYFKGRPTSVLVMSHLLSWVWQGKRESGFSAWNQSLPASVVGSTGQLADAALYRYHCIFFCSPAMTHIPRGPLLCGADRFITGAGRSGADWRQPL